MTFAAAPTTITSSTRVALGELVAREARTVRPRSRARGRGSRRGCSPTCFGRSKGFTGTNTPPAAEVPKIAETTLDPLVQVDGHALAALKPSPARPPATAVTWSQSSHIQTVVSLNVTAGASGRRRAQLATISWSCVCIVLFLLPPLLGALTMTGTPTR